MALDTPVRDRLTLPVICSPMFLVSGPDLVREACLNGVVGALPRQNARTLEEFDSWLRSIREAIDERLSEDPTARVGPIAVNLAARMDDDELATNLDVCQRHGVEIIISAIGNPARIAERVHDRGGVVYHDVTSFYYAEKAIKAGVDGLIAIGAGGGGHSGTLSHLVLIPRLRQIFDGTIVLAGAVGHGSAIRAAEILGADLAYVGTRFIAAQESLAADRYKQLLISDSSSDLRYTNGISGVPANWMATSLIEAGLDPDALPEPRGTLNSDHLPEGITPWRNIWSAGQSIEFIDGTPSTHDIVQQLRAEYAEACQRPQISQK
ncbi:NAD(P)H-dependent flavin oxidoreductase [Gordonia metallireducens]|uniref:NAD(P)H-dependent flavin oxidoreductase n=1 Tax=Gordonia metallireducens TaxID=2897779 RepID=UPI001E57296F|nr:nitronate monooxygenase [Gordonia metallireducens]